MKKRNLAEELRNSLKEALAYERGEITLRTSEVRFRVTTYDPVLFKTKVFVIDAETEKQAKEIVKTNNPSLIIERVEETTWNTLS